MGHDGLWVKKRVTEFDLDDAGIIVGDVRILVYDFRVSFAYEIFRRIQLVEH